jgi:VWFA-related protein
VVKISTNLIQVDVTVTDSKGTVVKDLKPEDFEIYENGEKQNISSFSFVSSLREKPETVKNPKDKVPIPIPQTNLRPEQIRRTIALVVDDLSLSFQSTNYVRRALKKFVDEQMQDGDLVAIIRTGAGIGALQQFTSDKQQLYAAIEKVVWNPLGRGNIGAFAPIDDSANLQDDSTENDEESDAPQTPTDNFENFRQSTFAVGTLGALRFIVSGMRELPGRKSVILFSDGFRIFDRNPNGSQDSSIVFSFLQQLVDAANRAAVVFYTVDARGLQSTGITAADQVSNPSPQNLQRILSGRSAELFDTQEGLSYLAEETGGFPLLNNNDLSKGVQRALDDQSYYLIGYEPDSDTFDAQKRRFNRLEVKIKRKGLNVRYRSGFFNVADENLAQQPTNLTPVQQIQNALVSPFAVSDISLRLNTLFRNDATQGSYVRSLLHVKAQDLKFTDEADGSKKAVFDVLAVSFGDNGMPVDQLAKSYTLNIKGETYQKILRDGFVYYFTFPIKKPGAYQFRVALRDGQAGKVGSASQFIQVPDLKKNRLTISGIVLENLTREQWQVLNSENSQTLPIEKSNPMSDTSLRRFKRGTILRYGFEIYNAKPDLSKKPNLTTQIRVFRGGKMILEGKQTPLELNGQTDFQHIKFVSAITLPNQIETGDYILQVIAFDNLVKEKRKIASQVVQFEVLE